MLLELEPEASVAPEGHMAPNTAPKASVAPEGHMVPNTAQHLRRLTLTLGMYLEKRSYSLLIWKASSLVWHMTSTDTCRATNRSFFPESAPPYPKPTVTYYNS